MGMTFTLENIIGVDALDVPVMRRERLESAPYYDILVLDPGQMVGWAGITRSHLVPILAVHPPRYTPTVGIEVGQGPWHACLDFRAERVFIERTPYASRLTFDHWPMWYTGAVVAKLFPDPPNFVAPTDIKVGQKWYSLPRGHGLGPHAKDALTHLVHVLVTSS